jgi:single-strand DNA-binding protein
MAGSVNKVTLLGNVGRDPEIRSTQGGNRIANFSIATSETWKDKNSGEKKERTEWHRIVIFNDGLVGVVDKYVRKGSKLYIEGSLQTRKWTDQQGQERYSTEVVLSAFNGQLVLLGDGGGGRSSASREPDDNHDYDQTRQTETAPASRKNDLSDDIPF